MRSVVEDRARRVVVVDGASIGGLVLKDRLCPKCSGAGVLYDSYDAAFCPQCNVWIEGACRDPKCEFCAHRPASPLEG